MDECRMSSWSIAAPPFPSIFAARQPNPFRNRCIESFTPAFFAIFSTRWEMDPRLTGLPFRVRNGNTSGPVRGSSASACRNTGCSGTHWSLALFEKPAGKKIRFASKSSQGNESDGSQLAKLPPLQFGRFLVDSVIQLILQVAASDFRHLKVSRLSTLAFSLAGIGVDPLQD